MPCADSTDHPPRRAPGSGGSREPRRRSVGPLRRLAGEGRHDVAGEAAQALPPPRPAAGAAAVDQDVAGPGVAQLLELLRDVVGAAVYGAVLVDGPRVAGGPVGAAVHGAVGPRGQLQLADPVLQPPLEGR